MIYLNSKQTLYNLKEKHYARYSSQSWKDMKQYIKDNGLTITYVARSMNTYRSNMIDKYGYSDEPSLYKELKQEVDKLIKKNSKGKNTNFTKREVENKFLDAGIELDNECLLQYKTLLNVMTLGEQLDKVNEHLKGAQDSTMTLFNMGETEYGRDLLDYYDYYVHCFEQLMNMLLKENVGVNVIIRETEEAYTPVTEEDLDTLIDRIKHSDEKDHMVPLLGEGYDEKF